MTSSKFIEILDISNAPVARANVSLADTLAQSRERSPPVDQKRFSTQGVQQVKTRLRAFSLKRPQS